MTFNTRYDNPGDGVNKWDNRKEIVTGIINKNSCDFVGLQEVLPHQFKFVKEKLTKYSSLYRTREISETEGEACPLFYLKDKWNKIEGGHFWLSDTPDIPASNTWNAACNRITTWGLFKNKKTGTKIAVYNTHYDHVSEEARGKSSTLIMKHAKGLKGVEKIVVMGDLNANETDKAVTTFTNNRFIDTYRTINPIPSAKDNTFNGWKETCKIRIDYIFCSQALRPVKSEVLTKKYNGLFPSDHLPVVTKFK